MGFNKNQMVWRGAFVPGQTYYYGEVVVSEGWTMVCREESTTEDPAPKASGSPVWGMPDVPAWGAQANSSVIYSGHQYTISKSGWIRALRVWAPVLSATTNYRFLVTDITDPANPIAQIIEEPILNLNDWTTLGIGVTPTVPGTVLQVFIDALNTSAETGLTGGWSYEGNNGRPPNPILTQGQWSRRNHSIIFIHKTDLNPTDRTLELGGMTVNSTIQIVQTNDTANAWFYRVTGTPIDQGAYMEYPVTRTDNLGLIGNGEVCSFTISTPTPQPTDYVDLPGQWVTTPQNYAVVSYLAFDGVQQGVPSDTGYGMDILFQPAAIPTDWEYLSAGAGASGTAGISGPGASTIPGTNIRETDSDFTLPPITAIGNIQVIANPAGGASITINASPGNTVEGFPFVGNKEGGMFVATSLTTWFRVKG